MTSKGDDKVDKSTGVVNTKPILQKHQGARLADSIQKKILQLKEWDYPTRFGELPEPKRIRIDGLVAEQLKERIECLLAMTPSDALAITQEIGNDWKSFQRDFAAFGKNRPEEAPAIAVVREEELACNDEIWVAGDVHADLLGFEAVLQAFKSQAEPNAKLIFLGDLIDRGLHDLQVVSSLLRYMHEEPGRYAWLVGNHDEGLQWNEEAKEFRSTVSPATFQEQLNEGNDTELTQFGAILTRIVKELPYALFLPRLLVAHGGFPLSDTWSELKSLADLTKRACLTDFVWNRWSDSKVKRPDRTSSSSEFTADDFHGFRRICKTNLGLTIKGMVRGHDHIQQNRERWERWEEVRKSSYEGRILTINTMSHNQRTDYLNPLFTKSNPRAPTLARWRSVDNFPTPMIVDLPKDLVSWYAPECPECLMPNETGNSTCVECNTPLK